MSQPKKPKPKETVIVDHPQWYRKKEAVLEDIEQVFQKHGFNFTNRELGFRLARFASYQRQRGPGGFDSFERWDEATTHYL